jgi:DNA polymerase-4
LPQATGQTRAILITARSLMATARPLIVKQGITLVGISVGNLENESTVQLALPFDKASNNELDSALDNVRDRFGTNAVTRGVLLGRDQGLTVPMLPD